MATGCGPKGKKKIKVWGGGERGDLSVRSARSQHKCKNCRFRGRKSTESGAQSPVLPCPATGAPRHAVWPNSKLGHLQTRGAEHRLRLRPKPHHTGLNKLTDSGLSVRGRRRERTWRAGRRGAVPPNRRRSPSSARAPRDKGGLASPSSFVRSGGQAGGGTRRREASTSRGVSRDLGAGARRGRGRRLPPSPQRPLGEGPSREGAGQGRAGRRARGRKSASGLEPRLGRAASVRH